MKRKELAIKLKKIGISDEIYNLYGAERSGTILSHNILSTNKKWKVYNIDERGNKLDINYFDTEDDACNYLYRRMVEFKWIMDNAHIHPDNKPKLEDVAGFEVSNDGKVNAILKQTGVM
ncbi:hypothetical protein FACS189446_8890 [Bacteroidia bacterium]|nr:hypothetical protein FACS189446_8890 [Bacteroidia bacterium]